MANNRTNTDRKFRMMTITSTYAETVWDALHDAYAPLKHGVELLARVADVVPRTAKNWLERRNAPRGDELVRLMAADPRIAVAIRSLVLRQRADLRRRDQQARAHHATIGRHLLMDAGAPTALDRGHVHGDG